LSPQRPTKRYALGASSPTRNGFGFSMPKPCA
jgi:hypothetical protein